jgi:Flp pilus assembly pilin Flp
MRNDHVRATRRFVRDTRGATITEYAIMLFLIVVACAVGFRVLGYKMQSSMTKAGQNLDTSSAATGAPPAAGVGGAGGPGGAASAAPEAKLGGTDAFGGPRVAEPPKPESHLGKFAMLALGIIGCGAAFFSFMKGREKA